MPRIKYLNWGLVITTALELAAILLLCKQNKTLENQVRFSNIPYLSPCDTTACYCGLGIGFGLADSVDYVMDDSLVLVEFNFFAMATCSLWYVNNSGVALEVLMSTAKPSDKVEADSWIYEVQLTGNDSSESNVGIKLFPTTLLPGEKFAICTDFPLHLSNDSTAKYIYTYVLTRSLLGLTASSRGVFRLPEIPTFDSLLHEMDPIPHDSSFASLSLNNIFFEHNAYLLSKWIEPSPVEDIQFLNKLSAQMNRLKEDNDEVKLKFHELPTP